MTYFTDYTLNDVVTFSNFFGKNFFDKFNITDETNTPYADIEYNGKGYLITDELYHILVNEIVDCEGCFTNKELYERATEALSQGYNNILPYDWFFSDDTGYLEEYKITGWNSYSYRGRSIVSLTIKRVEA